MPETRKPDRDVRLGARDEPLERGRLRERAGCGRDEGDEALADGDDLGHARRPARAAATAADDPAGAIADTGRLPVAEQPAAHPDSRPPRRR